MPDETSASVSEKEKEKIKKARNEVKNSGPVEREKERSSSRTAQVITRTQRKAKNYLLARKEERKSEEKFYFSSLFFFFLLFPLLVSIDRSMRDRGSTVICCQMSSCD